jgi:hypothetical protein
VAGIRERRHAYRIFVWKHGRKCSLQRLRKKCKDNMKLDFREMVCENCLRVVTSGWLWYYHLILLDLITLIIIFDEVHKS